MITKRIRLAAVLFIIMTIPVHAQDSPWGDAPWPPEGATDRGERAPESPGGTPPRLYGSISTAAQAVLPDAGATGEGELPVHAGAMTALRVKGDWKPSDRVEIYVEANVTHTTGLLNQLSWAQNLGLDGGQLALLQSGEVEGSHRTAFGLAQAWAQLRFPFADMQLGRIPIAWGTGYAFNPTMRTHPSESLAAGGLSGDALDVSTPGTAGFLVSIPVGQIANLEGYLAFEDRTHSALALAQDVDPNNLPWGSRVRISLGPVDASLGALKEVVSPSAAVVAAAMQSSAAIPAPKRRLYATMDVAGTLGDGGFYAEAALRLPVWDGKESGSWAAAAAVESTVGFEYALPGEVDVRLEYYRNGAGQSQSGRYDASGLLEGTSPLLGTDYLFVSLGRTFWDYLDARLAALGNLHDRSLIVAPVLSYAFSDEFTVLAMGLAPIGPEGSEFVGPLNLPGGGPVRLVRPSVLVQAQVTF